MRAAAAPWPPRPHRGVRGSPSTTGAGAGGRLCGKREAGGDGVAGATTAAAKTGARRCSRRPTAARTTTHTADAPAMYASHPTGSPTSPESRTAMASSSTSTEPNPATASAVAPIRARRARAAPPSTAIVRPATTTLRPEIPRRSQEKARNTTAATASSRAPRPTSSSETTERAPSPWGDRWRGGDVRRGGTGELSTPRLSGRGARDARHGHPGELPGRPELSHELVAGGDPVVGLPARLPHAGGQRADERCAAAHAARQGDGLPADRAAARVGEDGTGQVGRGRAHAVTVLRTREATPGSSYSVPTRPVTCSTRDRLGPGLQVRLRATAVGASRRRPRSPRPCPR